VAQFVHFKEYLVNFLKGKYMQYNQYDVYAQFLVRCREVLGPLDLEKLEYDDAYKADFFNRVALSADDQIFALADLVSRTMQEEIINVH
jgi:hypothetical protein